MPLSLDKLRQELKKTNANWKAGQTSMSNLSAAERRRRLGVLPDSQEPQPTQLPGKINRPPVIATPGLNVSAALHPVSTPSSFDLRNVGGRNYTTPPKNQGDCGSCVAFGVTASVETTYRWQKRDDSQIADFSEAQLFFCHGRSDGARCNTGWKPKEALEVMKSTGITFEQMFPYSATAQTCSGLDSAWRTRIVRIKDYQRIRSAQAMKDWIWNTGSLVACLSVYEDFQRYYRSGVYTYAAGSYVGGHCIEIVGYDDSLGCWICKNSWGVGWGESGFFRIAYGQCGIETYHGPRGITQVDVIKAAARVDAMTPFSGGVVTAFYDPSNGRSWGIYKSPDGQNPGGGGATANVYSGGARVEAMTAIKTGLATAFYDPQSHKPWGIYLSPDGTNVGGGGSTKQVYSGKARVDAIVSLGSGALTAFYDFDSQHSWGIYMSPDGTNLGGGGSTRGVYSGQGRVDAMVPFGNGVITAFYNPNTGRSWGIYLSTDGLNPGGGANTSHAYTGAARVDAMVVYKNGVITAFYDPATGKSWGIYCSPDGQNLGGGGRTQRVYSGNARVSAIVPVSGGVLTAFYNPSTGRSWGIYLSPDGTNLGGGGGTKNVYNGNARVDAMEPLGQGSITAFYNRDTGKSWGIYISPDALNPGGGGLAKVAYPL